jgi:hypothetical protein
MTLTLTDLFCRQPDSKEGPKAADTAVADLK